MSKNTEQHTDWGVSYGEMVSREFFKNKLNVASLYYIILMFAVAVLAPFIANDKPYVIRIGGKLHFPLFRNLDWIDYSIILTAIIALLMVYLVRRNRKKVSPSSRMEVFRIQLLVCLLILAANITVLVVFMDKRLDATDYKEMIEKQEASDAIFPPIPYGYERADLAVHESPPSWEHLLGTDDIGSDVATRLIYGTRISLSVGFVAVGISSVIGVFIGAILGYFGGVIDFIGMRIVEIMMAIPTFFLIITIVAFFPRSLFNIMIIIGITSWTNDARFIRAEFFKLRDQDFVQAARALGLPLRSLLFRHMLPNGIAPVLVNATFGIAGAIFIEAALSFLGFGVAPPTPSWGQMLSLGIGTSGRFLWWLSLFPGLAIFLTVTAYNLVGEGLRDAIDPRLRKAA